MRAAVVLSTLVIVGLLSISLAPGLVQRASASIGAADAVGILVSGSYFEADYKFTYTSSDCIQATLSLNGIQQSYYNVGCNSTGSWYGYLYAPPAAGTYLFQLVSTSTSAVEFSKSWTTPGFVMAVTASTPAANVGDAVGINAVFTLTSTGPDYLYDTGILSVAANTSLAESVYVSVADAHYMNFYGITPSPVFEGAAILVPVSWGTPGTKTVSAVYVDPYTVASGTVVVVVSTPSSSGLANLQSELNATRQELAHLESDLNATTASATSASNAASTSMILAYAALAVGIVGMGLGAAGFASARKARRERGSQAPPAQPPQFPQAPPPAQPPVTPPPAAPPPSPPLPPSP